MGAGGGVSARRRPPGPRRARVVERQCLWYFFSFFCAAGPPIVHSLQSFLTEPLLLAVTTPTQVGIFDTRGNLVQKIEPQVRLLRTDQLVAAHFLNNDRLIAFAGSNGVVEVFDRVTRETVEKYEPTPNPITALAISPDTNNLQLAVGTASGAVHLVTRDSSLALALSSPFTSRVTCVAFSPASPGTLVAGDDSGTLAYWTLPPPDSTTPTTQRNAGTPSPTAVFPATHAASVVGCAPSPINKIAMVSAGADAAIVLYDLVRGARVRSFEYTGTPALSGSGGFASLAFRADGFSIAAGTYAGDAVMLDLRRPGVPVAVLGCGWAAAANKDASRGVRRRRPASSGGGSEKPAPVVSVAFAPEAPEPGAAAATKKRSPPPRSGRNKSPPPPPPKSDLPASVITGRVPGQPRASATMHLSAFSPVRGGGGHGGDADRDPSDPMDDRAAPPPLKARAGVASVAGELATGPRDSIPSSSSAPRARPERDTYQSSRQTATVLPATKVRAWSPSSPTRTTAAKAENHDDASMQVDSPPPPPPPPPLNASSSSLLRTRSRSPARPLSSASPRPTSGTSILDPAAFTQAVVSAAIEDALAGLRDQMHADVQNLHLEVLRQFDDQREEMAALVREVAGVRAIVDENRRLHAELARMRGGVGGLEGGDEWWRSQQDQ
ncbi:WD40-repeat-containing domain protein [Blastocladiella britannica]|nr:WD40-repeat-containing domain protein [Blastocladiella britannica]